MDGRRTCSPRRAVRRHRARRVPDRDHAAHLATLDSSRWRDPGCGAGRVLNLTRAGPERSPRASSGRCAPCFAGAGRTRRATDALAQPGVRLPAHGVWTATRRWTEAEAGETTAGGRGGGVTRGRKGGEHRRCAGLDHRADAVDGVRSPAGSFPHRHFQSGVVALGWTETPPPPNAWRSTRRVGGEEASTAGRGGSPRRARRLGTPPRTPLADAKSQAAHPRGRGVAARGADRGVHATCARPARVRPCAGGARSSSTTRHRRPRPALSATRRSGHAGGPCLPARRRCGGRREGRRDGAGSSRG